MIQRASVRFVGFSFCQAAAEQRGAGDVSFGAVEFCLLQLLQVSRLRLDEQLVQRGDPDVVDQLQVAIRSVPKARDT